MRDQQDKKGGGLMVLHNKEQNYIDVQQVETKQKDILILRGKIRNYKVYLSVVRNETEKKQNQNILK